MCGSTTLQTAEGFSREQFEDRGIEVTDGEVRAAIQNVTSWSVPFASSSRAR
jgi:hypothetical protein